jgi:hypothetical protein
MSEIIICKFRCHIYNIKDDKTYYSEYNAIYQDINSFDIDKENNFRVAFKYISNNIYDDKLMKIEKINCEEYNNLLLNV